MKQIIFILAAILSLVLSESNAQVFRKADPVICPIDPKSYDTFVAPPKQFKNIQDRNGRTEANHFSSEIVVNYTGFTAEAQTAFQYAVDIWATLLKSPVIINVDANFSELGQGVLGSAGPTSYVRDFDGTPLASVFYPIPLAEKLAGKTLNLTGEADISANFSSTVNFYFGTDGNPPSGQYDFVSIVLHELGHGLGFTGVVTYDETSSMGSWDLGDLNLASIYTKHVELGDGTPITNLAATSTETGNAFTSNNLFFNGSLSVLELGQTPKLYAPSTWNQGSSYSHLDETEYPAGNVNSLMSPQFGMGEAIHDPGITLDMFADMGWVTTYLNHTNQNKITTNVAAPFTVELTIISDTTINVLAPKVTYTYSDFNSSIVLDLVDSGDGITFSVDIPNPGTAGFVKYYFSGVQDGFGRDYTSPGSTPANYHQINIINTVDRIVPYLTSDGGSFELNLNDFQSISLSGGNNIWELGVPTNTLNQAVSGTNVWKTKLNSNVGKPSKSLSSALISPSFDFSDVTKNHNLSFSYAMENAFTVANGLFETGPFGLQVQYSIDEGITWELLGEKNDQAGTNWYNVDENSPSVFPIDANAGWIKQTIDVVGVDTTFIAENVSYNVSSLTGNAKVKFRIVFYATQDFLDAGYEADGVLIDDFEIKKSSPTAEFRTSTLDILYEGAAVQFNYVSTGASTYLWEFGDGTTSDVANPTHIYNQGGEFDVTLTITSPDGTVSLTKNKLVKIIPKRAVPYLLADGGNLETTNQDFKILNVSGTGFELGSSTISGKSGTASGSNAFVIGINDELYVDKSQAYIYTPEFDFSSLGNYELSFKSNYSTEEGWDGFIIEYSLDQGVIWQQLDPEVRDGWYDVVADDNVAQGWPAIPLFTGSTNDVFVTKSTDVSFLGGEGYVAFRVKFLADFASVDVGMAFDDFELIGPVAGAAVVDFSFVGNTGCSGHQVVFNNASTGTIENLSWDFGPGATPATAQGIGPHTVTFESDVATTNGVTLTAVSSVNGTVFTEKSFTTAPLFTPESFSITVVNASETLLSAPLSDDYQWLIGGVAIDGATNKDLTITDYNKLYSVIVSKDGCSAETSEQLVISGTDEELEEFGIKVFPNPTKSMLNIDINYSFDRYLTVQIFDNNGRRIFNDSAVNKGTNYQKQINLSGQKTGIYHIEFLIDGVRLSKKILVE
jgi:PKD repeat protein